MPAPLTPDAPDSAPAATAIATPCIKVCAIEPLSGLCLGCGRSLREIGAWASLSPRARAEVMALLPARLARLEALRPDDVPD